MTSPLRFGRTARLSIGQVTESLFTFIMPVLEAFVPTDLPPGVPGALAGLELLSAERGSSG